MDGWGTVFTVLGSIVATGIGSWFLLRGKTVDQSTEVKTFEATAAAAFLQGQRDFQQYVDDVVDERVAIAVKGIQDQATKLEERLTTVQAESH